MARDYSFIVDADCNRFYCEFNISELSALVSAVTCEIFSVG